MPDQHKNFAVSTVATAPSPATSGTSLTVGAGHGARFPAPPFNVTLWPGGIADPTNAEIARVTAVAGDVFTLTRAQESSSARAVGLGDVIAATITAKTLTDAEAWYPGPPTVVRGLVGNAAAAGSTLALTADRAWFSHGVVRGTLSATLNLATAGPAANGRDQAGAFQNAWVYVYWILQQDGATVATLASATPPPTGPTLPTGYVGWCFATALRVGATANQWNLRAQIRGAMVAYESPPVAMGPGSATVETLIDVSGLIPPQTVAPNWVGRVDASFSDTIANSTNYIQWRYTSNVTFDSLPVIVTQVANQTLRMLGPYPFANVNQQMYYLWNAATGTRSGFLTVSSYRVSNGDG